MERTAAKTPVLPKMPKIIDGIVSVFPILFLVYIFLYLFVSEVGCVDGFLNAIQDILIALTGLGTKLIG